MTVLVILTLLWTVVFVLALVLHLVPTAARLTRTRRLLSEVADDLERAAEMCSPVDPTLQVVHGKTAEVAAALQRVEKALAAVAPSPRAPVS